MRKRSVPAACAVPAWSSLDITDLRAGFCSTSLLPNPILAPSPSLLTFSSCLAPSWFGGIVLLVQNKMHVAFWAQRASAGPAVLQHLPPCCHHSPTLCPLRLLRLAQRRDFFSRQVLLPARSLLLPKPKRETPRMKEL